MLKRKEKQSVKYENILYDESGVLIYEEYDGRYGFEIEDKFFTNDIVEAVSYLINLNKFEDDDFWNLTIKKTRINKVNPSKSIYWLSGGDDFWKNNNWDNHCNFLAKKFTTEIVCSMLGNDLKSIRENLIGKLDQNYIYSYFLKEKLIK